MEWTVLCDEIAYVIEGEFRLKTQGGELITEAGGMM
ncbi:hypothetical protein ACQU0X_20875 [Pseudovibrio ascidiaceicola]